MKCAFDPLEFVERLTRKTIFLGKEAQSKGIQAINHGNSNDISRNSQTTFDCAPFAAVFDVTMANLLKMAGKMDEKIVDLERETRNSEEKHKNRLKKFGEDFDSIFRQFQELDGRISKVGSGAVTIGDRLETDDIQRERALDGKELVEYLIEFNGDRSELEGNVPKKLLDYFISYESSVDRYRRKKNALKKDERNAIEDAKGRKLLRVSDLQSKEKIHLYQKAMIAKLLYNVALELDSDKMTKSKARIEIVHRELEKILVNQFASANKDGNYDDMREASLILFDFNGGDSCVAEYILKFKKPPPTLIKNDLELATRINSVEEASAEDDSRLEDFFQSITKICHNEHKETNRMFNNPAVVMSQLIHEIFEERIKRFLGIILRNDEKIQLLLYLKTLCKAYELTLKLLDSFKGFGLAPEQLASQTLIDSLFNEYRDNYIDKEVQSLNEIYQTELNGILNEQNESKKAGEVLSTTLISLETARVDFIGVSEEAVQRCLLLSHKQEVPNNLGRVFNTLITHLVKNYVNGALDQAVANIPVAKIKNPYTKQVAFIEDFFSMIYFVNQIVIFVQKHFHVDMFRHISVSANDLTNCENKKNNALSKLEDKIEEGMIKSLSALSNVMKIILSGQKQTDYKLRDDDTTLFPNGRSQTCSDMVQFIKARATMFNNYLDGKNVELILEEFGMRAYECLFAHYKTMKISQGTGGFRLLQDLTAYRECANIFGEEVKENFDVLKEISKVHNIDLESLKVLFTDTLLSKLSKSDVTEFISQRTDFRANWVGKYI
eukprot:TRINITY_DN7208_c0_g1_i2.p1 TRINITY_DN7208_c0_g1~~TRINITY_DN7208_c0_g1_i2.p1  ORF type:complete len:780 (+),score=219.42 TRINITY_DN7208_c0_g1_i2:37-2376(+)